MSGPKIDTYGTVAAPKRGCFWDISDLLAIKVAYCGIHAILYLKLGRGAKNLAQEITPKTIIVYAGDNDNEPYSDWFNSLKDKKENNG